MREQLTIYGRLINTIVIAAWIRRRLPSESSHMRTTATYTDRIYPERFGTLVGEMDAQRVLVIDDNRARGEGLMELLQLHGFISYVAFNGTDGIARARALQPDAVLLDLHMPDMNGVEVISVFRDDAVLRNVAIVLLTAEEAPISTHGSDAFLTYPVEMDTLKAVILGTVAKQQTRILKQRESRTLA